MTGQHETNPSEHVHAASLDRTIRRLGEAAADCIGRPQVQSLVEAAFDGVDAGAAGVAELLPESPDDDEVVDDEEEDDSVDGEVDDEAELFDLPPRLSVL